MAQCSGGWASENSNVPPENPGAMAGGPVGVGSGRDSGGAQAVDVRHRNRGHNSGGYHSGKLASWRVGEPFWVSPCFGDTFAVKKVLTLVRAVKKKPSGRGV